LFEKGVAGLVGMRGIHQLLIYGYVASECYISGLFTATAV